MGTSGEEPNKVIDATTGGLVWVRRRNGSWWPGKILGPEELPEGCVPTPRSGTPVKLLGREDASVDWYNLEKSKRVKDFHCGEYDDCIKKVKESASHLSKKAAKYARREDAILHALELERARLGKDPPDIPVLPDTPVTQDGEHERVDESPSASHPSEESEDVGQDLNSSRDDSDSSQEASESEVSFGRPDHDVLAKEESKQWRTPNDSEEEDGYEGVKRMRGLEDLGMGVASSLKSKRSQVAHVHELLKRKNRHRPLTKVMASATIVSVPVSSEIKVFELESNESKKNDSVVIKNNSDSNGVSYENGTLLNARRHASDAPPKCQQKDNKISSGLGDPENGYLQKLFDVPLVTEEQRSAGSSSAVSDASQLAHADARAHSSQCSRAEAVSLANEECNGSGPSCSGTANIYDVSQSINKGSSEWRFKGKRNSRSRKVDNEAETCVAGVDRESFLTAFSRNVDTKNYSQSLVSENGGHHVKSRPTAGVQGFRGWSWNAPQKEAHTQKPGVEQSVSQRLLPYRQSRFTVNPKYDDSNFSLRHHIAVSGLYDVPVQVKTSTGYRPQHVPYISLMSKLTGRPIIGHPLTIEVLKNGFSDDKISNSECYNSCSELDYNLSKRKPRGRPPTKPGPSCAHSSLSKSPKSRKSALLSKKTRKLSSLTGSHRLSREAMKPVMEKLKVPSIACVPLKVVFSRINAALTSSIRSAPHPNATSTV